MKKYLAMVNESTTPAPSRASNSNKKSNSLKTAYEGLGARMKKRGRVTTPFSDSELSVFLMKDTVGGGGLLITFPHDANVAILFYQHWYIILGTS